MEKAKKVKSFIWIGSTSILCVILSYLIFRFSILCVVMHTDKWKYNIEDFELYQTDFQVVADFCSDYIRNKNSTPYNWLSVSYDEQLYYDGTPVSIDEKVQKSLDKIDTAFPHKDAQLDVIRCYDDMVLFGTHNGQYSVAFSPNGRPSFDDIPEINDVSVKKITDDWYHVVDK